MISELDPTSNKYKSRLADYNSDPSITFQDLQKFLSRLEDRLAAGLAAGNPTCDPGEFGPAPGGRPQALWQSVVDYWSA